MSPFVLDNSVTMRWCFEHSATPFSTAILKEMIRGAEAVVPVLWLYEVVSVLTKSQRNGLITADEVSAFLDDLRSFPITIDQDSFELIFTDVHRLAVQHRLSGYDASYLELAIRKGLSDCYPRRGFAKSRRCRRRDVGSVMKITLKPETERLVEEELQSGHFHSVDEIIVQGVRVLRDKRQSRRETVRRLREFAERNRTSLKGISLKALIHEGHRL